MLWRFGGEGGFVNLLPWFLYYALLSKYCVNCYLCVYGICLFVYHIHLREVGKSQLRRLDVKTSANRDGNKEECLKKKKLLSNIIPSQTSSVYISYHTPRYLSERMRKTSLIILLYSTIFV